jgi:peroxiredoxin Q/BCP
MLQPGTKAPDFTLPDAAGKPVTLSSFRGTHHVVLFFYPKADTPVCTAEACAFRDAHVELQGHDAVVIGVSRDGQQAQQAFAQRWKLPFILLSDTGGEVEDAYRVRQLMGLMPGRVTYVIDKQGTIRAAHRALFKADAHVQQALDALQRS